MLNQFVVGPTGRKATLASAVADGAPVTSMFTAAIAAADTRNRMIPKTDCNVLETARRLVVLGNGRLRFSKTAYVTGRNPRAVLVNGANKFGIWVGLADHLTDLGMLGFEGDRTPYVTQSEIIADICYGAEFGVCKQTGDLVAMVDEEVAIVFTKPLPLIKPIDDLAKDKDQAAAKRAAMEHKLLL